MDMSTLYALLILLVPAFFAVIAARRCNFIHGLITYLFFTYVLVVVCAKVPQVANLLVVNEVNFNAVNEAGVGFFLANTLGKIGAIASLEYAEWINLAIIVVVFIVLQIIASSIANNKRRKAKRLKNQAKRY